MKRTSLLAIVLLSSLGCSSRLVTNTPRSAIEQLLLSGAVDKALLKVEDPDFTGKTAFLDFTNLKAYDQEYIKVATRARIAKLGATLVADADKADYVVEVASGGLGIEFKKGVVGIPALPVPNSSFPTPEAPAYRTSEQTGIVK